MVARDRAGTARDHVVVRAARNPYGAVDDGDFAGWSVIDDPRVSFVTGWFNEALPDWLDGRQLNTEATTLVHIDADLYSSCSFLLATLHGELDDYFVLFDEFGAGEARALRDYVVAHNAEFTPLLGRQRRSYSRTPGQVFGRVITRRRITTRPACR